MAEVRIMLATGAIVLMKLEVATLRVVSAAASSGLAAAASAAMSSAASAPAAVSGAPQLSAPASALAAGVLLSAPAATVSSASSSGLVPAPGAALTMDVIEIDIEAASSSSTSASLAGVVAHGAPNAVPEVIEIDLDDPCNRSPSLFEPVIAHCVPSSSALARYTAHPTVAGAAGNFGVVLAFGNDANIIARIDADTSGFTGATTVAEFWKAISSHAAVAPILELPVYKAAFTRWVLVTQTGHVLPNSPPDSDNCERENAILDAALHGSDNDGAKADLDDALPGSGNRDGENAVLDSALLDNLKLPIPSGPAGDALGTRDAEARAACTASCAKDDAGGSAAAAAPAAVPAAVAVQTKYYLPACVLLTLLPVSAAMFLEAPKETVTLAGKLDHATGDSVLRVSYRISGGGDGDDAGVFTRAVPIRVNRKSDTVRHVKRKLYSATSIRVEAQTLFVRKGMLPLLDDDLSILHLIGAELYMEACAVDAEEVGFVSLADYSLADNDVIGQANTHMPQTRLGLSTFFACLNVLAQRDCLQAASQQAFLGRFYRLTCCAGATNTLKRLLERGAGVHRLQLVAFMEVCYALFRRIVPRDPLLLPPSDTDSVRVFDACVFESASIGWAYVAATSLSSDSKALVVVTPKSAWDVTLAGDDSNNGSILAPSTDCPPSLDDIFICSHRVLPADSALPYVAHAAMSAKGSASAAASSIALPAGDAAANMVQTALASFAPARELVASPYAGAGAGAGAAVDGGELDAAAIQLGRQVRPEPYNCQGWKAVSGLLQNAKISAQAYSLVSGGSTAAAIAISIWRLRPVPAVSLRSHGITSPYLVMDWLHTGLMTVRLRVMASGAVLGEGDFFSPATGEKEAADIEKLIEAADTAGTAEGSGAVSGESRPPKEIVVVLFDVSGSMESEAFAAPPVAAGPALAPYGVCSVLGSNPGTCMCGPCRMYRLVGVAPPSAAALAASAVFAAGSGITRLSAATQCFHALANRCAAYDFAIKFSLITFNDKHKDIVVPPTESINKFVRALPDLKAAGGTSIWDAMDHARRVLLAAQAQVAAAAAVEAPAAAPPPPLPQLRILVLTDGQDLHSTVPLAAVAGRLQDDKVVVDAVVVAREADVRLKAVTSLTGGGFFRPSTLLECLSIFESEPFLSLDERTPLTAAARPVSLRLLPPAAVATRIAALSAGPESLLGVGQFRRPLPAALSGGSVGSLKAASRLRDALRVKIGRALAGMKAAAQALARATSAGQKKKQKAAVAAAMAVDDDAAVAAVGSPAATAGLSLRRSSRVRSRAALVAADDASDLARRRASGSGGGGEDGDGEGESELAAPPAKRVPKEEGSVVAQASEAAFSSSFSSPLVAPASASSSAAPPASSGGFAAAAASGAGGLQQDQAERRSKRLLREYVEHGRAPLAGLRVYPCEADLYTARVVMRGPDDSLYAGAVLQLSMQFPEEYPNKPPEIRFLSPVVHCNINSAGRICTSILGRNYHPSITLAQVLESVRMLLSQPEVNDPLDTVLADLLRSRPAEYQARARASVAGLKAKTFAEVCRELGGGDEEGEATTAAAAGAGEAAGSSSAAAAAAATSSSSSAAAAAAAATASVGIPEHLICPLTKELFVDPVRTRHGFNYERDALLEHIKRAPTDPLAVKAGRANCAITTSLDYSANKELAAEAEAVRERLMAGLAAEMAGGDEVDV